MKQGQLPWMNMGGGGGGKGRNEKDIKNEQYDKIKDKKISTPLEVLCKDLPIEFAQFIKMTREMEFEETPKYNELRGLF